jgi:3-hydroxybutyryl-CoA dehydrogenase
MKKICVIGAGTMGLDIAQTFAVKGYEVLVRDINDEIINRAADRLAKGLARQVEKGKMEGALKDEILRLITFTTDLGLAADADLVIEAIIENPGLKKDVFKTLDGLCKPETIFASNTSSISITEIASAVSRPDKFIGMHFFNPVPVMKLVEVIRGIFTSDETYKTIFDLAVEVGKDPVEVKDAPGFVVNKILIPMINESICVLEEGVASAEDTTRHEAGRKPPHRPSRPVRPGRQRRRPAHHERHFPGDRRPEIPPQPPAEEHGARRPARQKDREGLLYLSVSKSVC